MESPGDQGINPQNYHRCYISELPNEVLLAIFKCNSNMEGDLPLDVYERIDRSTVQTFRKGVRQSRIHIKKAFPGIATTLNSSQVNARWRDLIINTSTIWANLMNILFLDCVGDHFREEIIQRTQNALLHVEGKIYVHDRSNKTTGPWLSSFLRDNWARIRHLDLRIHTGREYYADTIGYDDAGVYRDVLSCLSMPADALESFTIQFPEPCDPLEIGSILFNDHAPRLQIFQTQRMIFNAEKCSWLLQLHQLRIFECYTPPFSSVDVLYEALSKMTNLEFLSLDNAIADPYIGMERAPIRLPRLRKMQIREDGRSMNPESRFRESTCWPLLTNVIPNPGCSIEVRLATFNAGDLNIPVLCRWASDYFDLPPGRSYLDFGVGRNQVWFADINLSGFQPLAWQDIERFLVFQLDYVGFDLPEERSFYRLLEALSLSALNIPHLNKATIMLNTEYAPSFFSDPSFASLISSVASVKKLYTVPIVLQVLTESDKKTVLFPCLKALEVIYSMPSQYDIRRVDHHSSAKTVLAFVDLQRQGGAPISRFIYNNQDPDLDDLSLLDGQCPGLEVAWKTRYLTSEVYYVCGDGSPEILDLINRSKAVMAKGWD